MKKNHLRALFVLIGIVVLAVLYFTARQTLANIQVEREWQTTPTSVPNLVTTTRMEIIPLYEEDRSDERFDFGHGVAYLIRTDSATILMDLGHNPTESA